MSLIWNTFGPWIVVAVLLLILALSLSGILRLARTHDWLSRENEVFMPEPQDRDRQQRELTEELRHDADLRAARKRRAEDVHRPQEAGATRPEDDDQLEADVRRLLGEDDEHTP
jgi:hypothetical protein